MDILTTDRLFLVSKPFQLGGKAMLARALSSADLVAQRTQASLAGLRMKQALDRKGDEYDVRVTAGVEFGTDEQLRTWIEIAHLRELESRAFTEYPLTFDPYPDDAKEEERQLVLEKREATVKQIGEQRAKLITDGMAAYQKQTAEWDRAKLEQVYTITSMKSAVDEAWRRAFENATLLYGIRQPDGEAYFAGMAEVEAVPDHVRAALLSEVGAVNDIDPLRLSLPLSTDLLPEPGPSSAMPSSSSTEAQP